MICTLDPIRLRYSRDGPEIPAIVRARSERFLSTLAPSIQSRADRCVIECWLNAPFVEDLLHGEVVAVSFLGERV
jgi:hypothetical protein